MSRQRRRKDRKSGARPRTAPVLIDERPWYFRYGYHLGVWSGAALGVTWYVVSGSLLGLIIGIVLGQVAGILLSRQGRSR